MKTAEEPVHKALCEVPGFIDLPDEERNRIAAGVVAGMRSHQGPLLRPWLFIALLLMIWLMIWWYARVVPHFRDVFDSVGVGLPAVTITMFHITDLFVWVWPVFVLGSLPLLWQIIKHFRFQKPMLGNVERITIAALLFTILAFSISVVGLFLPLMSLLQGLSRAR